MATQVQEQFNDILQNLLSAENETRSNSEAIYDTIAPNQRLELLLAAIQDETKSTEMRNLAAVLLRRLFTGDFDELWDKLPVEHQEATKQQLLARVKLETESSLKKKLCDATAELSRNLIDENNVNNWPGILQFLLECVQSGETPLKDSALHIFSSVPGIFANQQAQYMELIKQMLLSCLADNSEVRFSAAKAACSFLVANDSDQQLLVYFRDLLPGVLTAVDLSIERQTDDMLLKCLIDVAENIPKYFRPQLETVLTLCIKVMSNKDLEDSWRQLALEIVTTLAETASAMLRKQSKYLPHIIGIILQLMCELEEEDDWSLQDEPEDDEADTNPVAAESALDRIACGIGKTMLPIIMANVPALLRSEDWKCRHAALMAISACGEGCSKMMALMLKQIIDSIIPLTRDSHPRVRYAACNALGQMSTDFSPHLQKKFHQEVLEGLLFVLDDKENPRVQAHAGAALVNFCEECPKVVLAPYLDRIIQKLAEVLQDKFNELIQKGNKLVLEQIVTTLATVADSVEDKFIQYYDQFMPCLKVIIENAVQPELKLLRGKTIECVSLIGLAVGREKFSQDCEQVMKLLLASQTGAADIADDDPQVSYLISAWARMCKILGQEFAQFLPMVMPPVLKAAGIKPELAVLDSDEMKRLENDNDWHFVTLGDQQNFGIRTAGLEDKATACQMLVCYARELKQDFAMYTKEVVEIMVPLLKFYFHDDCRVAAAESLPYLLDCAKELGEEFVQSMWDFILPSLLKSIESEPEQDIQAEVMSSLAQCIEKKGKGALGDPHLQELAGTITTLLDDHFKRQEERHEQRKDEDYDEDQEENLKNEDATDVYILSKISDIIHSLFGTMGSDFLPVFEHLLNQFVRLIKPDAPWSDRQWGICIFDDLLEFTGPTAIKYQTYFLQSMCAALTDKQPEIRQASAYGIGVMAMFGQKAYNETLTAAFPVLCTMIQDSNSRSLENVNATENAISAVTKMCKYAPESINVVEVIQLWLGWLPVWEDTDEAVHVYGYMCDLFESQNPSLFGEDGCNIPHLVSIIAQVFNLEVIERDNEVYARLKRCITSLQSNAELLQSCISQLENDHREALYAEMNRP
ncbi:importin-5-like [Watersipora subatra]|uniref:importin-5-like n=1 Tax=Watersipora subatra TaxID=2589382 RepID=UPI00355B1F05